MKESLSCTGFFEAVATVYLSFFELFSFEFISHNPIASYCLVTFLPGQIRWSVRFPSTPLTGLIKLEEALPQRRTWLRFILQKILLGEKHDWNEGYDMDVVLAPKCSFLFRPWRTHIWSPLKPPEMNVMKVQWVKYVGHELGMYQRVEHAVSTRLECNVPRYSTEHGSHKRWIRWINCIGSEGRWRCPKKGCSRRGVIVWPVV